MNKICNRQVQVDETELLYNLYELSMINQMEILMNFGLLTENDAKKFNGKTIINSIQKALDQGKIEDLYDCVNNYLTKKEEDNMEIEKRMNFGEALEMLKHGCKVTRDGWNGKGMFLLYVPTEKWVIIAEIGLGIPKENLLPWIGMKTADGKFSPWIASQTDMLAEDWNLVVLDESKVEGVK
ncbi:MAG: DUF2829 domain-containing protein [Anaerovoracaceae bacterium]